MAIINYFKKEINVKIVYCGPGLSGKTTNLQWLNQNLQEEKVGKLISLATKTDRTLFFDLMAVSLGKIRGFEARIQLFTTPGQVFYNATRKLVLKGVDGVVFVADSQEPMGAANLESLQNLRENLAEYDRSLDEIPIVFQYNKRDLSNALSLEELQAQLNPRGAPYFEAAAVTGQGVMRTFQEICKVTFASLKELHEGNRDAKPSTRAPAPAPEADSPAVQANVALGGESDLQIRECLPPQLRGDHTVDIPLVLFSPSRQEEIRLTLAITLKS